MEQITDTHHPKKQQERALIQWLYKIEKIAFQIYALYGCALVATLLISWIFQWTVWGTFLLYNTLPWEIIVPSSLVAIIVFPIADTFIQSKEEQWFTRYGSSIQARVVDHVPARTYRWRWLRWLYLGTEQRAQLEWQDPHSEQTYTFILRVRDQLMPPKNLNMPVIIDYDDPTYYLKTDIKDNSLRF